MLPDALDNPDPQGLPSQGGFSYYRVMSMAKILQRMVLINLVGGYVVVRDEYDRDLHILPSEHNCPIFLNSFDI